MIAFQKTLYTVLATHAFIGATCAFAAPSASTLKPGIAQNAITAGDISYTPIDCVAEFAKFSTKAVPSFGGVMIDNEAYGTYGTIGSGVVQDTTVALVNGALVGSIVVALPGHAPNNPNAPQPSKGVGIEISKNANQTLIFKWTFDGTTYKGLVKSCTNRLWTASTGKSAIMLRVGT